MGTNKNGTIKAFANDKEIEAIDKLFRSLEKDKTLPTFGEFFMRCLLSGAAEKVNLKKLYPRTFKQLSIWLDKHNRSVLALKTKITNKAI